MKEILKELYEIFNDYGAICLAMVMLMFSILAIGFGIICLLVLIVARLIGVAFCWEIAFLIWGLTLIAWVAIRIKLNKEDKK